MENRLIKTKEIGDYRIKIYYDTNAECPVTSWDMGANYIFEYLERGRYWLSDCCDWKEWVSNTREHSVADILQNMVAKVVDQQSIINYYKAGKVQDIRFIYNRSARQWELQVLQNGKDKNVKWSTEYEVKPSELKAYDYRMELLEPLDKEELVALIEECAKNFVIKSWGSSGYSQGDHIRGVAYMSKERYDKYVGNNGKNWKKHALELIDAEVKEIAMWAWGDVKGFVLEKKVEYTKKYHDIEREDEEDFDWEEVDSCWGYYMETDKLIEEVISEHQLKEVA
jgi:hypothetical protein